MSVIFKTNGKISALTFLACSYNFELSLAQRSDQKRFLMNYPSYLSYPEQAIDCVPSTITFRSSNYMVSFFSVNNILLSYILFSGRVYLGRGIICLSPIMRLSEELCVFQDTAIILLRNCIIFCCTLPSRCCLSI